MIKFWSNDMQCWAIVESSLPSIPPTTGPQNHYELRNSIGDVIDGTFAYTRGVAALHFLTRMGCTVTVSEDNAGNEDEE